MSSCPGLPYHLFVCEYNRNVWFTSMTNKAIEHNYGDRAYLHSLWRTHAWLMEIASTFEMIGQTRSIISSDSMSNPRMSGLEVTTHKPKCASSAAYDSNRPTSSISAVACGNNDDRRCVGQPTAVCRLSQPASQLTRVCPRARPAQRCLSRTSKKLHDGVHIVHHMIKISVDVTRCAVQVVGTIGRGSCAKAVALSAPALPWIPEAWRVESSLMAVFDENVAAGSVQQ